MNWVIVSVTKVQQKKQTAAHRRVSFVVQYHFFMVSGLRCAPLDTARGRRPGQRHEPHTAARHVALPIARDALCHRWHLPRIIASLPIGTATPHATARIPTRIVKIYTQQRSPAPTASGFFSTIIQNITTRLLSDTYHTHTDFSYPPFCDYYRFAARLHSNRETKR